MNDYGRNAMHHGPGIAIPNKVRLVALSLYIVAPAIIRQPDTNGYSPLEHGLVRWVVRKYTKMTQVAD